MSLIKFTRRITSSAAEKAGTLANPLNTNHGAFASAPSAPSATTLETLRKLSAENNELYATVELKNRPHQVAKNDIIITQRMNDLKLGDVVSFDRVREIGGKNWVLRGNPFILPEYFSIKGVCIEHNRAAPITRRHWKKSGDTKYVTNQSSHTMLRISEVKIKSD